MAKVMVAGQRQGWRIERATITASLSDRDVDLMRELREEHRLPVSALAEKFEVSKTLVKRICRYEIRRQTPDRWKRGRGDGQVPPEGISWWLGLWCGGIEMSRGLTDKQSRSRRGVPSLT